MANGIVSNKYTETYLHIQLQQNTFLKTQNVLL